MIASVTVPATVANLGPGFDIFALALELENEVHAEAVPGAGLSIDPGPGADGELRDPARNLVARAYTLACEELGAPSGGAHLRCVNRIPFARGLGSSAAASLGGILAATALHDAGWDTDRTLEVVTRLEGHADNAAAALLGGLAISAPGVPAVTMPVPDALRAVVFMPDMRLSTAEARTVVARSFSREDAVFNAGRCALLVRALATGDLGTLGDAMEDRWHQPARAALFPAMPRLIAAAREAGARGAALAGAGPSVIALCDAAPETVEAAMVSAAAGLHIGGTTLVSRIPAVGARVEVRA